MRVPVARATGRFSVHVEIGGFLFASYFVPYWVWSTPPAHLCHLPARWMHQGGHSQLQSRALLLSGADSWSPLVPHQMVVLAACVWRKLLICKGNPECPCLSLLRSPLANSRRRFFFYARRCTVCFWSPVELTVQISSSTILPMLLLSTWNWRGHVELVQGQLYQLRHKKKWKCSWRSIGAF